MTEEDFQFLARLVRRRAGLMLANGKAGLIERRLKPVMRRFGFRNPDLLLKALRLGDETLASSVTEAMTVNETAFFRDPHQFEQLKRQALPRLLAARRAEKRLKLWSAGCAAGQEAWSLAMLLDGMELQDWTVDLLATDISGDAIARAEGGFYGPFEVARGLSPGHVARFFRPGEEGFQVADRLRRMVRFRKFNLLDSFGWLDDLDLILCRNVLIHFDRAARFSVLERMAETLAPDGLLVLGKAETIRGLSGFYRELPGAAGIHARIEPQLVCFPLPAANRAVLQQARREDLFHPRRALASAGRSAAF
jgi:chemotaxis protein methyltransferase CheR